MVAHRTITLAQEGAAIVVRAWATTPTPLTGSTAWSAAARAGYTGRSGTGSGPGRGRFSPAGERDLTRIAGCASTGALLHPGWSVGTDLPPLPEAEEGPEGGVLWGRNVRGRIPCSPGRFAIFCARDAGTMQHS